VCGIAGIVGVNTNRAVIESMLTIMSHRGPDATGCYDSEHACIGHCRLSINDLSEKANQPFVAPESKVAIAVNGEIYNFREIKLQLQQKGYQFRSKSDSEVVLHAYCEYGLGFIPKLNGMFAFAIWDEKEREVHLVRDRLGIKQLYYMIDDGHMFFASEIKAFACWNKTDFSLDVQSLAEYLAFENCFSNRTLNNKIKLLEPGEIVTYRCGESSAVRRYYWKPCIDLRENDNSDSVYDEYTACVESSVKRHLLSDVPLGSYLSSGIDSSSVTYWTSKILGRGVKTYTGFFGVSGFYDEASDAKRIADAFGCSHTRVEITPDDFANNIEHILWHLDEPKVGMGSFSQYMVAKTAARDLKVILTGHGGDELFAGYPVFKAIYGKNNIGGLLKHSSPRELMFAVYFLLFSKIRREVQYFLPNIFSLKSFNKILQPDVYASVMKNVDLFRYPEELSEASNNEYEHLLLTYLRFYLPSLFIVEDKISMAFSLESRTPLCDNELLNLALSIPLSKKLAGYELKHIPRTAMRGRLPDFLYTLPKRGFPTPLRLWFKNELKEYVRTYIMDNVGAYDIFNKKAVETIIKKFQNQLFVTPYDEVHSHKLWIILNLLIYQKHQKDRYGYR